VTSPAAERAPARHVTDLVPVGPTLRGSASWYGPGFEGRPTASGERYDPRQLTAAHKTLPLGTRLRVCRAGRCVVVRVNDRGPYVGKRFIDLSHRAASQVGITGPGVGNVTATVVQERERRAAAAVRRAARRTPPRVTRAAPRAAVRVVPAPGPAPAVAPVATRPVRAARDVAPTASGGDLLPAALAVMLAACATTVSRRARRSAAR
jgi:rare lipoprotein A